MTPETFLDHEGYPTQEYLDWLKNYPYGTGEGIFTLRYQQNNNIMDTTNDPGLLGDIIFMACWLF